MTWVPAADAASGIRVVEACCPAGLGASPVPARWPGLVVAVPTAGAFCHHAHGYERLVLPGAVVVGRAGEGYACSHPWDQPWGADRATAFVFGEAAAEAVAEALGARGRLQAGVVPPGPVAPALAGLAAEAPDEAAAGLALHALGALMAGGLAPPVLRAADRDRARAAAALVAADPASGWDLAAMARAVHTSPFHFLRAFRETVGVTPHRHVLNARLALAARLLADGDRGAPVVAVALAAGFGDLSRFTRAFKAAFGRPPAAWRRALPAARGSSARSAKRAAAPGR